MCIISNLDGLVAVIHLNIFVSRTFFVISLYTNAVVFATVIIFLLFNSELIRTCWF